MFRPRSVLWHNRERKEDSKFLDVHSDKSLLMRSSEGQ